LYYWIPPKFIYDRSDAVAQDVLLSSSRVVLVNVVSTIDFNVHEVFNYMSCYFLISRRINEEGKSTDEYNIVE
jgi:hypothetical protein